MIQFVERPLALIVALTLAFSAGCTRRCGNVSGAVTGTIVLAKSTAFAPQAPAVLYVMLRDGTPGAETTAPIAVRRYLPPFQFPMEFSISHHDGLAANFILPEKLLLSARMALKGSATPILPQDWVSGEAPIAVNKGSCGVVLRLKAN